MKQFPKTFESIFKRVELGKLTLLTLVLVEDLLGPTVGVDFDQLFLCYVSDGRGIQFGLDLPRAGQQLHCTLPGNNTWTQSSTDW